MSGAADRQTGLEALRAGRFAEAVAAFRRGAEGQDPEACAYLGLLALRGLGTDYDPEAAFRWTEEAARGGVVHAGLTLATLFYGGRGCTRDRSRALEILRATAARGHPPALRVLGLLHTAEGEREEARTLLAAAARAGDAFALHALAYFKFEAGDEKAAVPLLVAAARAGLLPARQRLRLFQKTAGAEKTRALALRPADPGTGEIASALTAAVPPAPSPPPAGELLAESLGLRRFPSVLHPLECDYLLALAAPFLRPAETTDPRDGRPVPTPLRTSLAASLHPSQEDLLTLRIEERILTVLGESAEAEDDPILERAEPLAVLHYAPGQEYRPHFDAYPPAALRRDPVLALSGQRTHTILTYLNDDCTGGATDFPRLGLRVTPKAGATIVFRNSDEKGEPLDEALHAGEPVATGEKWLATLWVRERAGARRPPPAQSPG